MPLMRKKFVGDLKWLEENEMMDIAAIAQTSPGAVAVNAAILLGYKVGGILGAVVAMIGTVIRPLLLFFCCHSFMRSSKTTPLSPR